MSDACMAGCFLVRRAMTSTSLHRAKTNKKAAGTGVVHAARN